jgi:hypothetical protein
MDDEEDHPPDEDKEEEETEIEFLSLKDAAAFPVFASMSLCTLYIA